MASSDLLALRCGGVQRRAGGGESNAQIGRETYRIAVSLLHRSAFVLAFAVIYAGAAKVGDWISIQPDPAAGLWLPSGVYLTALLISERPRWWTLVAGAVVASVISDAALHDRSAAVAFGFALTDSLEALGAAWLLQQWRGRDFQLSGLQDMTALALVSALSCAICATIKALIAATAVGSPFQTSWPLLWSSDLVGILLIVPLALTSIEPDAWRAIRNASWRQMLEILALVVSIVVVSEAVFGSRVSRIQVFPGAVFPFLLWAALRCRLLTLSAILLLGSFIVVSKTAQGLGPFGGPPLTPVERLITSQMFLGVGALSFLVLGALTRERQRARDALGQSEERLQLALSSSKLALWDWDLPSRRVYVSENWSELLGTQGRGDRIPAGELRELVHPDDRTRVEAHMRAVLSGTLPSYDIEYRVRTAGGTFTWVHTKGRVITRDARGRALRLAGTTDNITFRKAAEEELYRRATRDPLTGLWNRSVFLDRLQQAANRCERSTAGIAVCYLDVDNFKLMNDRFGHAAGDELLKQFSARLNRFVRRSDTFARVGGDEFAVLLESISNPEDLRLVCENVLEELRPAFSLGPHSILVTTSIGAAWCRGKRAISATALLEHADNAMYVAKRDGRNRFSIVPAA
jgi:diguanylate cyclase (GGDEF)-like protein/PAS domain S-box-containing protein